MQTGAAPAPCVIRAVLFDMDGTLADSEPIHERAMNDVLLAQGIVLPAAFSEGCVGLSVDRVFLRIKAAAPQLQMDQEQLAQAGSRAYLARRHEIDWRPGAQAALQQVDAAGVRWAVVSNSDRMVVGPGLEALGLAAAGRITVTRNDVRAGKPAPEPYLRAAWLMGLQPQDCLVVEDSPTGAAAGLAAGMTVLAWPEANRQHLVFPAGCQRVAPDALAATLRQWLLPAS